MCHYESPRSVNERCRVTARLILSSQPTQSTMIIGETKIKAHLEAPFESYIVDTSLDEFDYDAAWHYLSTEAYWVR
jgi:hypothetical protein